MKKTSIALAMLAGFALAQPATAADMPVKAAPMMAPAFNWSGFYIGTASGVGIGHTQWQNGGGVDSSDWSGSGGISGLTVGYNFQASTFVLGVEGDVSYSTIKAGGDGTPVGSCTGTPGRLCSTELKWLATYRGRVGVTSATFGSTFPYMLYLTGGGAYGRLRADIETAGINSSEHDSFGYTGGAGAEFLIPGTKLSAKAEYLYVALPGVNNVLNPTPPINVNYFRAHLVRFGMNWHF